MLSMILCFINCTYNIMMKWKKINNQQLFRSNPGLLRNAEINKWKKKKWLPTFKTQDTHSMPRSTSGIPDSIWLDNMSSDRFVDDFKLRWSGSSYRESSAFWMLDKLKTNELIVTIKKPRLCNTSNWHYQEIFQTAFWSITHVTHKSKFNVFEQTF